MENDQGQKTPSHCTADPQEPLCCNVLRFMADPTIHPRQHLHLQACGHTLQQVPITPGLPLTTHSFPGNLCHRDQTSKTVAVAESRAKWRRRAFSGTQFLFNICLVPYQAGTGRRASSACLYHHAAHQSQWQIQHCKMGGTKLSSLESESEPRRCANPTTAKSGIGCFSLLHHGSQDTGQVVPKINFF